MDKQQTLEAIVPLLERKGWHLYEKAGFSLRNSVNRRVLVPENGKDYVLKPAVACTGETVETMNLCYEIEWLRTYVLLDSPLIKKGLVIPLDEIRFQDSDVFLTPPEPVKTEMAYEYRTYLHKLLDYLTMRLQDIARLPEDVNSSVLATFTPSGTTLHPIICTDEGRKSLELENSTLLRKGVSYQLVPATTTTNIEEVRRIFPTLELQTRCAYLVGRNNMITAPYTMLNKGLSPFDKTPRTIEAIYS